LRTKLEGGAGVGPPDEHYEAPHARAPDAEYRRSRDIKRRGRGPPAWRGTREAFRRSRGWSVKHGGNSPGPPSSLWALLVCPRRLARRRLRGHSSPLGSRWLGMRSLASTAHEVGDGVAGAQPRPPRDDRSPGEERLRGLAELLGLTRSRVGGDDRGGPAPTASPASPPALTRTRSASSGSRHRACPRRSPHGERAGNLIVELRPDGNEVHEPCAMAAVSRAWSRACSS